MASGIAGRRDAVSYIISLLRSNSNEHCDSLPELDVAALKHVAYTLDALMGYLRCCQGSYTPQCSTKTETSYPNASSLNIDASNSNDSSNTASSFGGVGAPGYEDGDEEDMMTVDDVPPTNIITPNVTPSTDSFLYPQTESLDAGVLLASLNKARRHHFFQRCQSTLCIGSNVPDVFCVSLQEALPLAEKPQLLQPNSRREDLWGVHNTYTTNHVGGSSPLSKPLNKLGFTENYQHTQNINMPQTAHSSPSCCSLDTITSNTSPYSKKGLLDSSILAHIVDHGCVKINPASTLSAAETSFAGFNASTSGLMDLSVNRDSKNDSSQRAPIIMPPRRVSITTGPSNPSRDQLIGSSDSGNASSVVKSVIVRVGGGGSSSSTPYSSSSTSQISNLFNSSSFMGTPQTSNNASTRDSGATSDLYKELLQPSLIRSGITSELLLGRWQLTLELFGRVFIEDVGQEPGSIIVRLEGFPIKEARFRRDMEKLRNNQPRDLNLSKMERERGALISQTFKEFNAHYSNWCGSGSSHRRSSSHSSHHHSSSSNPPLAVNRVKVAFKDEPGEGSGVARSYYTALAEALLSDEPLPSLDNTLPSELNTVRFSLYGQYKGRDRRGSTSSRSTSNSRSSRKTLSVDARPYYTGVGEGNNDHMAPNVLQLAESLYHKVHALKPSLASKITGMLVELSSAQMLLLTASDEALRQKVEEAADLIVQQNRTSNDNDNDEMMTEDSQEECTTQMGSRSISAPLFYQPGKRGFYSPRQAKPSYERLSAFRNVGRLLGLCLLQNELCPISLNRHVLKYILLQTLRFHDLAFFDPSLYESLRKLVQNTVIKEGENVSARLQEIETIFRDLDLNFSVDLIPEEGGGSVELCPGGCHMSVTPLNVAEYVRLYALYRMQGSQQKALENLRDGVLDVIPSSALEGLTAEDLRLLLNGVGDINVNTLIYYTSFNDESAESPERLLRFKKWLWSIIEKMTSQEKQDLVYFWTGSPALPASEEGFQPLPSVTIRPADDTHLPTANTCISRLYIPLYSCRNILRAKLLLAIKTKNFGFV